MLWAEPLALKGPKNREGTQSSQDSRLRKPVDLPWWSASVPWNPGGFNQAPGCRCHRSRSPCAGSSYLSIVGD